MANEGFIKLARSEAKGLHLSEAADAPDTPTEKGALRKQWFIRRGAPPSAKEAAALVMVRGVL